MSIKFTNTLLIYHY